jgi:nucleoside-diphosphate kinase
MCPKPNEWRTYKVERSLVLLKPDAVQRGLLGTIISRLENKGLKLVGIKMMQLDEDILANHYSHLTDKPFYPDIADFMRLTPVVAICVEGLDCVDTLRRICGVTLAREADPGTIRGDLSMSVQANLIHASDSVESAEQEIERFFRKEELFDYRLALSEYIYSRGERG